MATGYVLYNPKAGAKNNIEDVKFLETMFGTGLKFFNMLRSI